uniref:Phospholipase D n=1 Tax=Salix viminalis TaxID=40686 RepID=A0A6N2KJD6_SALVM
MQPESGSSVGRVMPSTEAFRMLLSIPLDVDDEYITIGSANINQRSTDASRDTEIEMEAYHQAACISRC